MNIPKTIPPTKAIDCGRNKDSKRLNPKTNPIAIAHIIATTNNTVQVILNASFKLSPPKERQVSSDYDFLSIFKSML